MSEPVVVDPEQIADVLEAAADYIETNGWWQGMMLGPRTLTSEPTACVLGAIAKVMDIVWQGSVVKDTPAVKALDLAAGQEVWKFNDAISREQWEVDELLRTTAKRVRAGDLSVG